ncbi:hypothetical protein N9419_02595 [Candidatus Pelagibacter sp.]|nr:hypothetical protein [Candidatus Pelagibacter sp.]
MFSSIKKFFFRKICIIIVKVFSPRSKLINFIFNLSKNLSGDSIYFCKYKDKEKLISFLNKKHQIENKNLYRDFENIEIDENIKLILKDLNINGLSENFNSFISKNESENYNHEINNSDYYDSHVPYLTQKKNYKQYPDGPYKSYSYETQLNNETIIKICLDEKIIKIAKEYLGSIPKIYSINTFVTLPGKKAFTHDFHRDIDNLKWLVVFVYWTKTLSDDGAFEQIKYTHKPSLYLEDILKKNNEYGGKFDDFFLKTVPGYGKNDKYHDLFNPEIINISGDPGKIVMSDTLGLHRGTNVKKIRNVTWIRYGVTSSRQDVLKNSEILNKKIRLSKETMKFINNSKFGYVLSDLIEL